MPISPAGQIEARRGLTSSTPARTAASISSRVIAGPRVILRVPGAIRVDRSAGWAASGPATPTSATMTSAPAQRASTLTAAPPRRKFSTICAVTICG
jgi:hypothetical protein